MKEIVANLAKQLGLPESTIESALAVIIRLLKEKAGAAEFEKLAALIPGIGQISESTPGGTAGAGLPGMLGALGGLLGGQAADAAKAFASLQQAGVPVEKIPPLARGFFEQVRAAGGGEIASQIASAIPALKSVLGESEAASR